MLDDSRQLCPFTVHMVYRPEIIRASKLTDEFSTEQEECSQNSERSRSPPNPDPLIPRPHNPRLIAG